MQKARRLGPLVAVALGCATVASAQHYQSDFPPEEFRARWTSILERIGNEAVAVAQGAPLTSGFQLPRQSNTFYYLCGIETPGSLPSARRPHPARHTLPPPTQRAPGAVGGKGPLRRGRGARDAVSSAWTTSAPSTEHGDRLALPGTRKVGDLRRARPRRGPRAEPIRAEGRRHCRSPRTRGTGACPGRRRFVELLRLRNPRATIQDLTPILDELRSVKSPREIALVRRASQLAGLGVLEAMRSTEPGAWEYQLDAAARYVFLQNGARLDGYRSITASGTENIWNAHYYRNDSQLRAGDLVLMDYAPDYRYYVSDIGRMWPVGGAYAPWQRELLQFVLEWRNAVLPRIRPGVTTDAILAEARAAMEPVLARTRFSKPEYEKAARKMLETSGGVFSHPVGMAVHDVGGYRQAPLKPGQVFAVDPQLWVPEDKLYIRYEDTVVVTDTGVENFTAFLPSELDAIEAVVRGKGVLQSLPALTEAGFEALRAGRR